MAGRRKSHSEQAWASQPEHVVRCVGTLRDGNRCRKVADDGTNVCEYHGGSAPQVQRAAAERMVHSAPAAAEALLGAMNNPGVPWGVRVKIMQDVLDRSGLAAAQVHKIMPMTQDDPVERLFQSILNDPEGLAQPVSEPPALAAGSTVQGEVIDPAQDAYDRYAESHQPDAEVVEISPSTFGKVGPHAMSEPTRSSTRIPRHIAEGLGIETRR